MYKISVREQVLPKGELDTERTIKYVVWEGKYICAHREYSRKTIKQPNEVRR
jgi:hypothetical protein